MGKSMVGSELGAAISTMVLSTLIISARIVSKFYVVRRPSLDDSLMIAAWVISITYSVLLCWGTTIGIGKHTEDFMQTDYVSLRKCMYALSTLYIPAFSLIQISVLVFYLQLAKNVEKELRLASLLIMGVVVISGTVFTFLSIFQCRPISLIWEGDTQSGSCISYSRLYLVAAPINLITSSAIVLMPLPVITKTRIPTRQKVIVTITLMAAGFATIVDVVRVYYLEQAQLHGVGDMSNSRVFNESEDSLWYASYAYGWAAIELNVAIICACVPSVKPLVAKVMPYMIYAAGATKSRIDVTTTSGSKLESQNSTSIDSAQRPSTQASQDMGSKAAATSSSTIGKPTHSKGSRSQKKDGKSYFNLSGPKNLLKANNQQSMKYCLIVSFHFFVLGFSWGILNYLNVTCAAIAHVNHNQSIAMITAYYGGYLIGPPIAGFVVLKKFGFRIGFVTGLLVYAVGGMIFWPSAVLLSYPGFILSNLVVGSGLAILETSATAFVVLCGPTRFGVIRICLCHAVMAISKLIGKTIGSQLIFRSGNAPSVLKIQWIYLALFFAMIIAATIFYYIPFPEATDEQLEDQKAEIETMSKMSLNMLNSRTAYLYPWIIGSFSLFCYYGCQQISNVLGDFLLLGGPHKINLTQLDVSLMMPTMVCISRLSAAVLCYFLQPPLVLLGAFCGALIFAAFECWLHTTEAGTVSAILLVWFFYGSIAPLTSAFVLQGKGHQTRMACITVGCAQTGAGVWPWVYFYTSTQHSPPWSLVLLLSIAILYPLYINLVPTARWRFQLYRIHDSP